MTRKARDYAAEYRARKARALAEGIPLNVARGHPKMGQVGLAELRQMRRALHESSYQRRALQARLCDMAGIDVFVGAHADVARRSGDAKTFVDLFTQLAVGTEQEGWTLVFSPDAVR